MKQLQAKKLSINKVTVANLGKIMGGYQRTLGLCQDEQSYPITSPEDTCDIIGESGICIAPTEDAYPCDSLRPAYCEFSEAIAPTNCYLPDTIDYC